MSKIETVKNKRGANLAIGEVKPNSFSYYDDCTIDVEIFVYSDDFSKRCSFWLENVRTGFTGESWIDGYYDDELESNPDFTSGMELSEIYTDEELEERAMDDTIWLLFDSYSLEDNPIFQDPIIDCINRIEDAIAAQQVYLFNEDCAIEDPELDSLLLDSPEEAWSDLIEEDILDYDAIDEDDHQRVDYFKKETLKAEAPADDDGTVPEEVSASALDYCRVHPASCLLLPLAICEGMLKTHFLQPAGLPAKVLKKLGECDWTDAEAAESVLVSVRNLVLSELKKARWVDVKDEYFYRYEYCSDAVEKAAAELRSLCRLLGMLCPKEGHGLDAGQSFEFNTDRSRDFLRLREEYNLVIPEKVAYDFLVGNDLRQQYSQVILDKDEQTTRLSLIQSEVFSIIEDKYIDKNTPQGLFDAALTLKEYDGGSFAGQILETESEDDYFSDDGSSIVFHGVCYHCSDSEYTMSGGRMVQKNPGLMRVSSSSEMPYRGLVHILSSVNYHGREYPVVNIDEYAFQNCDKVKSVVIDEGLYEISSKAFSYCTGLADISLPKSLKVLRSFCFEHCTGLKSIFIPAGVTDIENDCFDGCSNLAEIIVDEANPVYMSADGVLCDRKSGQRLYVPDANKAINDPEPTSHGEVIEEGDGVFSVDGIRYDELQERDYSNGEVRYEKVLCVLPLKDGSYTGKVVIPAEVKYKKRWRRVTQIEKDAFSDCPDLVELSIPAGVRDLAGIASGSPRLRAIYVDEANEEFTSMDGVVYNKEKTKIVCFPEGHGESFEIPSTVRSIDDEFNDCISLRHIVIPQSVTRIYWGAFKGCSGLQEIDVPGSVKCIQLDCFNDCTGLQSITLGEGIQSVESAFHNCSSLKKLILPDSLETVSISAFGKCGTIEEVRFPKGRFPSINAVPKKFYPWGQPPFFLGGVYYEPYFDYHDQTAIVRVANVPKEQLPQTSFPGIETVAIPPIVEQYGFTYVVNQFWSWCQQFPDLHRLELPETVVDFRGNISSLREYVVDGDNPEFAAIDGVLYSKDLRRLISAPRGASTKVVVRDGVEIIEEKAFEDYLSLEELVLSDSVREIKDSAFNNCTSLRRVHFNKGLEKIGSSAFINTALTSVVLPASLKDVNQKPLSGRLPFFGCRDLKEFVMGEEGGPLTAIDGVLYEKTRSGLRLIHCPPGFTGRLTIPDGVCCIGDKSMWNIENLEAVIMPDSVERIESWAIAECKSLKEVVISRGLKYVGSCAFCNCPSLQELNFARCKHYFGYDGIDTSAFMKNPQLKLILPVDIENRRQYFEREMNKKTGW